MRYTRNREKRSKPIKKRREGYNEEKHFNLRQEAKLKAEALVKRGIQCSRRIKQYQFLKKGVWTWRNSRTLN